MPLWRALLFLALITLTHCKTTPLPYFNSACAACPPLSYYNGLGCAACGPGTFRTSDTTCAPCQAGTFSLDGMATACVSCTSAQTRGMPKMILNN